jgi:hypothetical protein
MQLPEGKCNKCGAVRPDSAGCSHANCGGIFIAMNAPDLSRYTEIDREEIEGRTVALLRLDWSDAKDKAWDAFWDAVLQVFPNATSGDLSPLPHFNLSQAADAAIAEWVYFNVPNNRLIIDANTHEILMEDPDNGLDSWRESLARDRQSGRG